MFFFALSAPHMRCHPKQLLLHQLCDQRTTYFWSARKAGIIEGFVVSLSAVPSVDWQGSLIALSGRGTIYSATAAAWCHAFVRANRLQKFFAALVEYEEQRPACPHDKCMVVTRRATSVDNLCEHHIVSAREQTATGSLSAFSTRQITVPMLLKSEGSTQTVFLSWWKNSSFQRIGTTSRLWSWRS
jgi:hypothetical protein